MPFNLKYGMDKIDNIWVINRISQLRTQANLSARALSQAIDLNEGYINRLESKKDFLPSVEVLLRIAEACSVSMEEFFYHNGRDYKNDMRIMELLDNMTSEKKEAMIAFITKK